MAPHSSTFAWKIPWAEEPGRLQSMGSLRVGHDWATSVSLFTSCIGEGNGNPLQCSCLENPRDRGALWAAVYGVAESRTRRKRLSSSSSKSSSSSNSTQCSSSSFFFFFFCILPACYILCFCFVFVSLVIAILMNVKGYLIVVLFALARWFATLNTFLLTCAICMFSWEDMPLL